jgi:hypothetical protein
MYNVVVVVVTIIIAIFQLLFTQILLQKSSPQPNMYLKVVTLYSLISNPKMVSRAHVVKFSTLDAAITPKREEKNEKNKVFFWLLYRKGVSCNINVLLSCYFMIIEVCKEHEGCNLIRNDYK